MSASFPSILALEWSGSGFEAFCKALSQLILPFIYMSIAFGLVCSYWAAHRLYMEWKEFQKRILDKTKNAKLTPDLLKELMDEFPKDGAGKCGLASYKRIEIIYNMIQARGQGKHLQALQMRDLHQLSEQTILSAWAPSGLRIITGILLVFGVCGTLWGVHSAIPQSGSNAVSMKEFADALNPSRLAVFFTIVFLLFRGVYAAVLDNFLRHLDRETMIRFLPLIPESDIDQETTRFAASVAAFNDSIKNALEPAESASAEYLEKARGFAEELEKLETAQTGLNDAVETLARTHGVLQPRNGPAV